MLCALLLVGTLCFTACGNKQNGGTEAPYEDETNKDVNDTNNSKMNNGNNMYNDNGMNNNGMNNNGMNNNGSNGTPGGDLEDAGRNLMDSIKDTGDAIRDGVNNMGNNNRTNP